MVTAFNTSAEVAASGADTAVVPLGSVEPKGPHLPVGLDILLADRFACDLCAGSGVYLLPVFPFSSAPEQRGFRGCVSWSSRPCGTSCGIWRRCWPGRVSGI